MDLKNKLLSKSNQFKYYKDNYEKFKNEVEKLKKERDYYKKEYENAAHIQDNDSNATSFCFSGYTPYFYRDDFEEKFYNALKNLPPESKKRYKYIFIRTLLANYRKSQTLFTEEELNQQKAYFEFRDKHIRDKQILNYKFVNNDLNVYGFMDKDLTDKDKDFIKNKDIIDAGAFTGDSAIPLSQFTSKNVYAFEPFEDSFYVMIENLKLNNIENVVPELLSLSNVNGYINLYLKGNNFPGITSDPSIRGFDEKLTVKSMTLDKYVEDNDLNVGLIKVDVEGAEKDLLEGAVNTIKTQKPILFLSIYHRASDFFELKPWIEDLGLDYQFTIRKDQPWAYLSDTILECRPFK